MKERQVTTVRRGGEVRTPHLETFLACSRVLELICANWTEAQQCNHKVTFPNISSNLTLWCLDAWLIDVPTAVCQQVALCVGPSREVQVWCDPLNLENSKPSALLLRRQWCIRGHRDLYLTWSGPVRLLGLFLCKLFKHFTAKSRVL